MGAGRNKKREVFPVIQPYSLLLGLAVVGGLGCLVLFRPLPTPQRYL